MRVLFDQATPVPIRVFLKEHVVRTAAQEGWDRLENWELLVLGEQQWPKLRLHVDLVVAAINAAKPGILVEVDILKEK